MLKNKFGMTKVLVLVLSVLMLVSLVACNKADGPSTDDMNAAIQAAIDAANAEQAAKEAALAASIAADKAAQEAKDAALAESLAKEKAENDAALKKAQEEAAAAKKAADEAAKKAADEAAAAKKAAEDAAKKAAEDASKKAQEEAAAALKAAEEAAKKAQEEAAAALKAAEEAAAKAKSEADRVASELAAELEAAKAEALKAQEEAAKAQEEASKAIAEASKAAEEAAKASSQLAETTVVAPVETTVVVPGETTVAPETTAPVIVDKADALLEYSKLKVKYTITEKDYYLTNDYAELVLLFDKASIDLNNAATAEAAASIVSTLEVDAAAVTSAKTAAADVQALIAALGDIETEVFTVQATKLSEIKKAYDAFKTAYKINFDESHLNYADDATIASKLSIKLDEYNKAVAKLDVLKVYIANSLQEDMKFINDNDPRFRYDASVDVTNGSVDALIKSKIDDLYYRYLILASINDGDVSAANLAIAFEQKKENNVWVDDTTKPTKWFTAEELLEVYILPTLDAEFEAYIANAILKPAEVALVTKGNEFAPVALSTAITDVLKYNDYDDALDAAYDALETELEALSFVADYKGTATLNDAKADVIETAIKAYLSALEGYLEAVKVIAIDIEEKATADDIEEYGKNITALELLLDEENAPVALLNSQIARWNATIETAEANLAAFIANVEAATLPTYEELLNEKIAEDEDYMVTVGEGETATKVSVFVALDKINVDDNAYATADVVAYLNQALKVTIANNFVEKLAVEGDGSAETDLLMLVNYFVSELQTLRLRVDSVGIDNSNDIYLNAVGDEVVYLDTKYYKNEAALAEILPIIDAAIAEIQAVSANDFVAKDEKIYVDEENFYIYVDAAAKAYIEAMDLTIDEILALTPAEHNNAIKTAKSGDYPIYYQITPAEQAAEKAADLFVKAFDAVNKKLVAIDGYAAAQKKLIYNSEKDKESDYYKVLSAASDAALKAELEAVGNAFLTKIDDTANNLNNNFKVVVTNADDKNVSAPSVDKFFVKSATKTSKIADMITINVPAAVTYALASNYDYDNYQAAVGAKVETVEGETTTVSYTGVVKEFFDAFYVDGASSTALMDAKAAQLYAYKLQVVKNINTDIASYKNQYQEVDGVVDIKDYNDIYTYELADRAAWEAELDTLVATYIANINSVTLQTKVGSDIKNGYDEVLIPKKTDVAYDLDVAKDIVDEYYNALFGTDGRTADLKGTDDTETFKKGDSQIFKSYNSIVLGNIFGYTVTAAAQ